MEACGESGRTLSGSVALEDQYRWSGQRAHARVRRELSRLRSKLRRVMKMRWAESHLCGVSAERKPK